MLEAVKAAHRAARDSIWSCTCNVEIEIATKGEGSQQRSSKRIPDGSRYTGQYRSHAGVIRVLAVHAHGREDCLAKDDKVWTLTYRRTVDGREAISGSVRKNGDGRLTTCDVWPAALLTLNRPGSIQYLKFEELLEKASGPVRTRQTAVGLIEVSFSLPKTSGFPGAWDVELLLDPSVNHLVRRVTYQTGPDYPDGIIRREQEVVRFAEASPGLFFPAVIETRIDFRGARISTGVAQIRDLKVNSNIPASALQLAFPPGMEIADSIRGAYYRVDARGMQTGKEKPFPPGFPPLVTAEAPGILGSETTDEPPTASFWLTWGSVISLALAGAVALWNLAGRTRLAFRGHS